MNPFSASSTDRLRVLQVGKFYPPHKGGIETHTQLLCQELKRDCDVSALVCNDSFGTVEEHRDGIPVTRVSSWGAFAGAPLCPSLALHLHRAPVDVVHVHLPHPTAILAWLASGQRASLVAGYHSDIVRQKVLGAAFTPWLEAFLRCCSVIMVASPDLARTSPLLQKFQDRIRIVPYGIPYQHFQNPGPAVVGRLRQQYGPGLVLSVGRLVYYKGFEHLIRSMRDLPGRLLIIGDGPLRPQLERLITELKLFSRVTLLGNVEDVIPYYHAADVFVLPSVARSEAFGIVQLEAMACGKPVINTQLDSGVPYVSPHGITGLTVPPADSAALSKALRLLLSNPELQRQMGEAGRARVRLQFSVERMTSSVLEIYRDVLAQADPSFEVPPTLTRAHAR